MRNRTDHRKPALRRLAHLLATAAVTAAVLQPGAAFAAGGQPRAEADTWSMLATLDPAHVAAPRSELVLYGVYAFTPILVNFNPHVLDPSINQSAVPMYAVPDAGPHTYKVVFHLTTDVTTATRYRLGDRPPVTVAGGDADVEFTDVVQAQGWRSWPLRNADNDHWLFYSVKIYERIG